MISTACSTCGKFAPYVHTSGRRIVARYCADHRPNWWTR